MTAPAVITGCGLLCAAGDSVESLRQGRPGVPHVDVTALYAEPMPHATAPMIADFDIRRTLGRKGTSCFDRATGLAVIACGQALRDAALSVDDGNRARLGVVLGTTLGSLKSTMDYSRETLVQERPYLVNPALFPNTVMNCAAGQAAIWYGLRGVNATVAGGQLAFLHSLRYALSALRQGYVDALLVGGVEEYTPHRAWSTELVGDGPAGEAAVVFVVERDAGRQRGSRAADLLAVATGFCASDASGGPSAALAGCVRRALARAGADPCQVRTAATGDAPDERVEADAVTAALGRRPRMLNVKAALGECHAASGGLALAMALAAHRQDAALAGGLTVITGRSRDGGVAAAVVRGCGGAGVDRE